MKKGESGEIKRICLTPTGKNNSEALNSLEVISGGKLCDIARPSISRGSARSVSQLSIQSKASFELETLPNEKDAFINHWTRNNASVERTCDTKGNELFDDIETTQFLEDLSLKDRNRSEKKAPTEQFNLQDDKGMNSKEFEKEILKISKRIIRAKKQPLEHANSSNEYLEIGTQNDDLEPAECFPDEAADESVEENEKEEEMSPEIKKGLEKIQKLDNILAEKVKLEKEVKADRRRMEKEWQVEIKSFLEDCGENKSKPGIQQFLALTNGITDEDKSGYQIDDDFVPVFPTEVETNGEGRDRNDVEEDQDAVKKPGGRQSGAESSNNISPTKGHSTGKKEKKRNFLKRNKELAGHANEIIALTEEERHRLDELLADDSDLLSFENPFSKNVKDIAVTGYEFDENSKRALSDIDEKLKMLVPESDFQSICSTPHFDQQSVSHRSLDFSDDGLGKNLDTKCKEPALQEGKEFRDMRQRLQQIESELCKIDSLKDEQFDSETPRISHELLRQLIDVDDRLTSSALSILDSSNSQMTERTLTPSSTEGGEFDLESYRSVNTEKSYCSVGV